MASLRSLSILLLAGLAATCPPALKKRATDNKRQAEQPHDDHKFAVAGSARHCLNITIPIRIHARQGIFPNISAQSNLEVTAFAQEYTQQGRNYTDTILQGYNTVEGRYSISAKYCYPGDEIGSTIQVLSHGIGFDKTYWDLSYDDYEYSYTNVALAAGYSTLAIDRLGIGNSSRGEPINEIQAQLEVEALNAVTTKVRKFTIPELHRYDKVVHVGHSFGSVQSYWLSALYPNNTDGLVLTGWSANGNFFAGGTVPGWNLQSARLNQPRLNYPPGYLTHNDLTANQFVFLRYGAYDIGLGVDTENNKQPVTIGEILTIGSAPAQTSFSGPVLVYTGQYDQPFCGLDCFATGGAADSIPAQAAPLFPNAKAFEAYIQPNTGHGINAHYNSSAGNDYVQSWLMGQGLNA